MTNVIVNPSEAPYCPLCLNRFVKVLDPARPVPMYVCTRPGCMISISSADPMVDRYHEVGEKEDISCPKCETTMRFFCRSDGYMKSVCPKCHAAVEFEKEEQDND